MAPLISSSLEQLLSAVGVLSILWFFLKTVWDLGQALRTYLLSEVWKAIDLASYGPWAVVTGATAGIGKAYAHELARRGLNVVLISRSMEKLMQVAAEIEEQYGRKTKVIQADFTYGLEIYERIRTALEGLEIGILVNNVGLMITRPLHFLQSGNADQYIDDIVRCNMVSIVKMTQMILPQMVDRKKGIIINMSSSAAWKPMPLLTLYSSTKVFDDFFSEALDIEYKSKGIIVQSIMPMFVESNLTHSIKKFVKKPAEPYARQALNTIGFTNRTAGCLSHAVLTKLYRMVFQDWLVCSSSGKSIVLFAWKILGGHTSKQTGFLERCEKHNGQSSETSSTSV